jgi:hypothetical protein
MTRAPFIPTLRDAIPFVERALSRARRYGRPMSIVLLRFTGMNGALPHTNGKGGHRFALRGRSPLPPLTGYILWDSLRDTDIIAFDHRYGRYLIAMPEVARAEAQRFVERISKRITQNEMGSVIFGICEYPSDALTVEDLIKHSQQACEEQVGTVVGNGIAVDAAAQRSAS